MKKKFKILLGVSSGLLLSGAVVLTSIHAESYLNYKNYVIDAAYAISDGYYMNLNSSNSPKLKYSPFYKEITFKNYNDEDIVFVTKRAQSYSGGFIRLSGGNSAQNPNDGGCFYNDFIEDSKNFNGLDGITSITVVFSSLNGKLTLKTGKDLNYNFTKELTSGVETTFSTLDAPSHFSLENLSGAGSENDVSIESITIKYHSYSYYEDLNPDFDNIMGTQAQQSIAPGASYTVTPNYNATNKNYLKLLYETNQNIKGEITYHNNSSTSTKRTELFYLEKDTTEFKTFLDAFRNSAKGKFEKTIESIKFTNVGKSTATFTLKQVFINNTSFTRSDNYFIQDSMIKASISLKLGGAISGIQNISTANGYNIQEYVTTDGEIKIRSRDNNTDDINNVIVNHPNLVNTFDLGREVQQSYYIGVDSSNGYTRGTYQNKTRDYNPVQAGDDGRNESQIVDFKITKLESGEITSIYVKTKACDWAKDNSLTNSYMENTYTIKNSLLYVTNRFVDWSGFTNYPFDDTYSPTYISNATAQTLGYNGKSTTTGYVGKQQLELPAFYVSHPLKYYSTVADNNNILIFDDKQGWDEGTSEQAHAYYGASGQANNMVVSGTYNGENTYKSSSNSGSYHYATRIHPENWLGYFNEDHFGVAVYIPANNYHHEGNRHVFLAGNYNSSHNADQKVNRAYLNSNYETTYAPYNKGSWITKKVDLTLESYLTDNNNYMSTKLGFFPHEYVPIEWTYAIGADYLNNLRTKFRNISDINNDFRVWSGAEI